MPLSAIEKLRRFHDLFNSDDHVLIPINADPDAIASAMAIKRLLWRKSASVTIANINTIKRPDNLAMIDLLAVPLQPLENIDPRQFNRLVMVDSQPDHNLAFGNLKPDAIIDHHPECGSSQASFVDIRPKYGANASIMTEYLRAAKIKPSVKLATGLFYAIKTDTDNFERPSLIEDVRAFQFLYRHANVHLARKIEQAELQPEFIKYFRTALGVMRRRKGKIYAHLGTVSNPDVCVLVADFFMKINSVSWSIVSGIYDRKLIVILRNDGIRKNAGRVAQQSFGALGSAGGHKSMARAEMQTSDLKDQVDHKNEKTVERWIINRIEKRTR